MNKKNTILWIVLMALMLFNFWIAEFSPASEKWALAVILIVTMVKFLGVAFRFMELKEANSGWRIIFFVFVFAFVLIAGLV